MFGAVQYVVESNSPFTKGRLLSSIDEVGKLPERIDPEHDGWGPKLKDLCERFLDATHGEVPVCVADHQSPYGVATKLIGNEELMLAMYDAPGLVDRLLTICANATIDVICAMRSWVGEDNLVTDVAHPIPGEGGIVIWDDYISVLTPSLHRRFCCPQNLRLYETFGRGHLHTCGPYFEGYIDAVLACEPVSVDICDFLCGTGRQREDMLRLRQLTAGHGIKLVGGLWERSGHGSTSRLGPDRAFLEKMAQGGLLWTEHGDRQRLEKYASWAKEIPN